MSVAPHETYEYEARVRKGMDLLDQKLGPYWVHHIDLDSLDLSSSCQCVFGQLYDPDYGYVPVELDLDLYDDPDDADGFEIGQTVLFSGADPETVEHGFLLPLIEYGMPDTEGYRALTQVWRRLITERREATCSSST